MDFVRENPSAAIQILQSLLRQLRSQAPKTHVAAYAKPPPLRHSFKLLIAATFTAKAVPPFALFGLP
jgi:hypothetical protein